MQGQICSGNGKCKGDGTRKGNGKCACDSGYGGETCNRSELYRVTQHLLPNLLLTVVF